MTTSNDLKFTTAGEYMSDKGYELCSLEQAEEFAEFRQYKTRHLETSKKIVEFVRNNPPSYKQKVKEAPKHIGYEN
jgi:hypothetical protein